MNRSSLLLVLPSFAATFLGWWTVPAPALAGESDLMLPGEVIVCFRPGVVDIPADPGTRYIPIDDAPIQDAPVEALLQEIGVEQFEVFAVPWRGIPREREGLRDTEGFPPRLMSFRDYYVLHFSEASPVDTVVARLHASPQVESVSRHLRLFPDDYWPTDVYLSCPSECGRGYQWNLENTGDDIEDVDCEEGLDIGLRGAYAVWDEVSVKVGVLDSGVDAYHDDLNENIDMDLAYNATEAADWQDATGHGTGVAGIIGAEHSTTQGVAGIAGVPGNDDVIKVLSDQSGRRWRTTSMALPTRPTSIRISRLSTPALGFGHPPKWTPNTGSPRSKWMPCGMRPTTRSKPGS